MTTDLSLDVPVTEIFERGDRLKRRRRRRVTVVGVAATVFAATAASIALPQETSPLPQAEAAWGPHLVNLSGDDLAPADQKCRDTLDDLGWHRSAGAALLAGDTRDGVTVLFYREDDAIADCWLVHRDTGLAPRGASTGRWRELPAGTYVDLVSLSYASLSVDGPARDGAAAVRVSPDVDRLEVEVAGESRDALVAHGVALFWLPSGVPQRAVDHLTVTAYDRDDNVLYTGPLT